MSGSATAEILPTHTPALFTAAVERAAELLRAGHVVALPTETVYGLTANALDSIAVGRIYEAKGRPSHNPVIVHVADLEMARACVREWPALADRLAAAFWPGPLTLVLPRSDRIPPIVSAGGDTVGIRWPGHPFMLAVIRRTGLPLAAPSANLANHISPTNAQHVARHLGDRLPLIVDGGQCQVGLESTVVDLTSSPPRILRPGMVTADDLKPFGVVDGSAAAASATEPTEATSLKSPGQLAKHYSPKARMILTRWRDAAELDRLVAATGAAPEKVHVIVVHAVPMDSANPTRIVVVPDDPEAYARALYAALHRCDDLGAEVILVETPPAGAAWQAIRDRLGRAASP